ncbi:MAG: glutamine--tRNA ligase, partial [Planctomycetaceae bacterium]|nr:glutamine--tRNA ligase [Planctomycetaceae bacterium]
GRKVKATLHWVPADQALNAEVRLYDHLFHVEDPGDVPEDRHFTELLNPNSLEIICNAKLEPSLADARTGDRFQFERLGYFSVDQESRPGALVFNRAVTLKDTWAKANKG